MHENLKIALNLLFYFSCYVELHLRFVATHSFMPEVGPNQEASKEQEKKLAHKPIVRGNENLQLSALFIF